MSYKEIKVSALKFVNLFPKSIEQLFRLGNVESPAASSPPVQNSAPPIDPDPRYHGTELVMLYDYKV